MKFNIDQASCLPVIPNLSFHNISNIHIPPHLVEVLGRGLKFTPPTKPPSNKDLRRYFEDYAWRLATFETAINLGLDDSNSPPYIRGLYKESPYWDPQMSDELNAYMDLTFQDVCNKYKQAYKSKTHLPRYIKDLIKLKSSDQFKIIPTDKNLGLAVISNNDYYRMCMEHLQDATSYEPTEMKKEELLSRHLDELRQICFAGLRVFGQRIKNLDHYLAQSFYDSISIPKFHCIAKIHKWPIKGRPIAGNVNWITTYVSKLLSHTLRSQVESRQYILKDSRALISQIEHLLIPGDCILVTMDITALYPSMKQALTLEAISELDFPRDEIQRDYLGNAHPGEIGEREFAIQATRFVLQTQYVEFNNQVYHQTEGMAMGTNAAPEIANLYVDYWIENGITYQLWKQRIFRWFRFIDDIFLIWKGTRESFETFKRELELNKAGIKFTYEASDTKASFLDLEIFKRSNNRLGVRVFQKALNKYLYIPADSYHPEATKLGFIKGECIRYARNCTDVADYNIMVRLFRLRLQARGYEDRFINRAVNQVKHANRLNYLTSVKNDKPDSQRAYLIMPYHHITHAINITSLLKRHWHLLSNLQHITPMMSYTSNKNISSLVTTSQFTLPSSANQTGDHNEIDNGTQLRQITNIANIENVDQEHLATALRRYSNMTTSIYHQALPRLCNSPIPVTPRPKEEVTRTHSRVENFQVENWDTKEKSEKAKNGTQEESAEPSTTVVKDQQVERFIELSPPSKSSLPRRMFRDRFKKQQGESSNHARSHVNRFNTNEQPTTTRAEYYRQMIGALRARAKRGPGVYKATEEEEKFFPQEKVQKRSS